MKHEFKVGDHAEWNSEGYVRGKDHEKVTSGMKFKTYTVLAVFFGKRMFTLNQ